MTAQIPGKSGWFKAAVGSVAGLMSGAFLMYVSPLVERVVRPDAPVANFEARTDGLKVTFANLSLGKGLEGWWDFGDGSPLLPLEPERDSVTHFYQKPGDYTVKLSVRNVLGDSNERSVPLHIEADGAAQPPRIAELKAESLTPEPYAPATFRVSGEVQGAQFCVWDTDEGRPLEAQADGAGHKERLVTFSRPGNYVVKLAAFGDSQQDQKSVPVRVLECPRNSVTAVLTVDEEAVCMDRRERPYTFGASFKPDLKGDTCEFTRAVPASPGMRIGDVRVLATKGKPLAMKDARSMPLDAAALGMKNVRDLVLEKDADGKSLRLKGKLVRGNKNAAPPGITLQVVLFEERRKPQSRCAVPVTATLCLPGSSVLPLPPLPPGWEKPTRKFKFELREGTRTVWQDRGLPRNKVVAIGGKAYLLTASPSGDRVQVSLANAPPGAVPSAN
jgi:PKD repeat protein